MAKRMPAWIFVAPWLSAIVACAGPEVSGTTEPQASLPTDTNLALQAFEQRRAADRVLLSNPAGLRSELERAARSFNECVNEHIAIYLTTTVDPELAARTTVAECGPRRWQPIVDVLDRARIAGVKLDEAAIVTAIREDAHRHVVSTLSKHSI